MQAKLEETNALPYTTQYHPLARPTKHEDTEDEPVPFHMTNILIYHIRQLQVGVGSGGGQREGTEMGGSSN